MLKSKPMSDESRCDALLTATLEFEEAISALPELHQRLEALTYRSSASGPSDRDYAIAEWARETSCGKIPLRRCCALKAEAEHRKPDMRSMSAMLNYAYIVTLGPREPPSAPDSTQSRVPAFTETGQAVTELRRPDQTQASISDLENAPV
jgi:hypothetical protein